MTPQKLSLILEAVVIYILAVSLAGAGGQLGGGDRSPPSPSPAGGATQPANISPQDPVSKPPPAAGPGPTPNNFSSTTTTPASPSPRPFTKGSTESNCNSTNSNSTEGCGNKGNLGIGEMLQKNKGMLQRAIYVLAGVTVVILIYFALRTWSTRKRKSKAKKYGLITTPASDLEMAPLDGDDDDEDMTVFEVNGLHK